VTSRRPLSTYRLQLGPSFTFADAAAIVPYLGELGITDLYISPPFACAPGSQHGYDIIDHNRLRPELGGEDGYAALCRTAAERGMGLVVDFVPNHVGIGPFNPMWMDLLENGPSAMHAHYFDIDWNPVKQELINKVLVPVLGDQYGAVLESGELKLEREDGAFFVSYWEQRFPIAPRQVPRILEHRLEALIGELGEEDLGVQELLSVVTALKKLAPRHETEEGAVTERAREKEVAKRRLSTLLAESAPIRRFVDENVRLLNGAPGNPRSVDILDGLLDSQAYRLAHWRVAGEEINYRRFFDINALAAIRMEDERVFAATHALLAKLAKDRCLHGVRIDHPDGLYAPTRYFRALRELLAQAGQDPYIIVEKILEWDEPMPASWSVDGTTGYEFLNTVDGLFVDRSSERAMSALYARIIGRRIDYHELSYQKKKLIMRQSMASEINTLAHRLNRISESDRRSRDFTLGSLGAALVEYIACLPIYRTYIEGQDEASVDARDRRYIEQTIDWASRRAREVGPTLWTFLRDVLLLRHPAWLDEAARAERAEFVGKLQQLTGPVGAKAVEDTAFYVYNRLSALNEVGGEPNRFGCDVATFHRLMAERLERWPGSLNTSSTHDTKRSEDVRLRILLLSEIPGEWERRVRDWSVLCRRFKTRIDGELLPDRNDEYLFYQTVVGALPADGRFDEEFIDRMQSYMQKAEREAKVHSSWANPSAAYEEATARFVAAALGSQAFVAGLQAFCQRLSRAALLSSLAQSALKCCAPGVTDVYQGAELWALSLVDPDNRRPVDFAARRRLLAGLAARAGDGRDDRQALAHEVLAPDRVARGDPKLFLLRQALRFRRDAPELFLRGEYLPLAVEGEHAAHIVAFARRYNSQVALCVVPRLMLALLGPDGQQAPSWRAEILLPPGLAGRIEDVASGAFIDPRRGRVAAAECFQHFPVLVGRTSVRPGES
jgi:(1->4)-alpha-D-glucan 1-alpha-D-glucosylmutase